MIRSLRDARRNIVPLLDELYDLECAPLERNNLEVERDKHSDLLDALNAKLKALIEKAVGEGIDQVLRGGAEGGLVVTDAVYDV